MRKLILSAAVTAAVCTQVNAQTIFTYGNTPVSETEFLKVYKKNNAAQTVDFSDKAIRDYIDLYSLFRMKVAEANAQQLDTAASVAAELDNYRRQLSKSYLTDDEVTNRLIHEAYDRSKEDVHVAHILLLTPPQADTLAIKRKADSLYQLITVKKVDFAELAGQFSEDKGSKTNGGDIGFMGPLQYVYPFENVAYGTAVGKVSTPFRTQFGYHIVKVLEKRPARGEVKVAQILVSTPKSTGAEGIAAAKLRVDSIERELKKGASFESLVKKYSDDKFTADKNGEMPVFGVGRMIPVFEQAAFSLNKPGDVAKAVQTDYGFHIIKLLEKYPLKPFDSVKKQMKVKVENDSRAQQARDMYFEKVRLTNGYKEFPKGYDAFIAQLGMIPDTGKNMNQFTTDLFKNGTTPLFTLGGKNYTQDDFVAFAYTTTRGRLTGPKDLVFRELYVMYLTKVVTDFQEHKLVDENPEFRGLMQEYRDGIMLFELMDRNVWGKASKDTTGLKAFYETKKDKYQWEPGFKGAVYTFKNEAVMKEGLKLLAKKDMTSEQLVKTMNNEKMADAVTVVQGRYEFSKFTDVPRANIVAGKASEGVKKGDKYVVVKADEVFTAPVAKTFMEARGYVVSAYQDNLEQEWNRSLRSRYPVKVNDDVVKKIAK